MENIGEWEQKNLKNELVKGKELARQLQSYLNLPSSSSSLNENGELLVQKILSSFEKVLSMLNYRSFGMQIFESPSSLNGSPRSEDSDHDQRSNASKKRNIFPTWTQKFKVSPGMALEGSLEDGFCWRKYGQKGILGAKHPRGYYRCTNRNLQGCLATKQVQRSDNDPTVFEITYRGNHTCSQVYNLTAPSSAPLDIQHASPDIALLNPSWPSLRVITENLDNHEPTFLSFNFDSTSNYEAANHDEPVPTTFDANYPEFSPPFIPPAASGLSEGYVGNQNLHIENKSPLSGIFPSQTLAANSPTLGLEFPFGEIEMEPSFTFDNSNFFS